ncbi:nuclear transport factor 2 family protein [Christiangramia sediminis]|uniref:Nuclear transport factor 2 family protein n=1 Tax=Christiangramia sediminis TaxID=2881336 RepID=A0A9X1LI66_9FLAO|nr:nuclear transport factor 2 family protein [Christiangramia sediminis]MCB7480777.1 nuclear transport factor 2 family protein [Christiangramia sediminis]
MKNILTCLIALHLFYAISAQESHDSNLFKQLKSRDSLLFDLGFNKCKIEAFEMFISEDLEFYHDQGGLSNSKEDFLNAVKKNICAIPDKKPIRKLIPESLEVYPLYENGKLYGAIQKGNHDFYIQEPDKEVYKTSSAKFTHIWILVNNEWILKRVLSYDHKSPE